MVDLNKALIIIILLFAFASFKINAEEMMKIGIAIVNITPEKPIWLNGYSSRNKPSEGVIHPIYAKALAFEDKTGSKSVLVTTDIIGFNPKLSGKIANRVKNEFGIPRAHLMLTSSHTHAAPILYGSNLTMFDLSEKEKKTIFIFD